MYDTPIEAHTNLPHDLPYHIVDGAPVLDNPDQSE